MILLFVQNPMTPHAKNCFVVGKRNQNGVGHVRKWSVEASWV